ncbi:MAG: ABC transporter ATP-binding protein [Chloroflexi bacterium]|nr:ABC transporter ATP-binding protein [Chloroflexota bacterium]
METESLTKYYGSTRGIENLNLDVREGEVFGYLGPNGAGKTTTIRLLMDFIRPTRGRATLFGRDSHRDTIEIRRRVGYLPGEYGLYDLTVHEFLTHIAALRGGVDWGYTGQLAERLDLDLGLPIRTMSHGNRQKVGLIQALMHRPALLILDEPTLGLDPLMQQEFYRLITEVKAEGRTVFFSSHILPEVERTCDRVGIVREGSLVAVEEIAALKTKALRRLEIIFDHPAPADAFALLQGVRDLAVDGNTLHCAVVGHMDGVLNEAAKYHVVNIRTQEPSLEEIFLTFFTKETAHAG